MASHDKSKHAPIVWPCVHADRNLRICSWWHLYSHIWRQLIQASDGDNGFFRMVTVKAVWVKPKLNLNRELYMVTKGVVCTATVGAFWELWHMVTKCYACTISQLYNHDSQLYNHGSPSTVAWGKNVVGGAGVRGGSSWGGLAWLGSVCEWTMGACLDVQNHHQVHFFTSALSYNPKTVQKYKHKTLKSCL